MMLNKARQAGFTLVELAIVLVIIGLIVGGILVGQDLIRAAEIRATVAQLEQFDAAVNTFRTKYNALPGDISTANRFPLESTNGGDGTSKHGDGDGLIESGTCSDAHGFGGESAVFWKHLAQSALVESGATSIADYEAVAAIATLDDSYMIPADIGKNNRFHVTSLSGRNYYTIGAYSAAVVTTCALTSTYAMTPLEALQIDEKKDDGIANTGVVVAIEIASNVTDFDDVANAGSSTPDGTGANDCYDSDDGFYATTTDDLGNAAACSLRIRTSF